MKNYKSDDFLRVEKQQLLLCSHRNLLARKASKTMEITRIIKIIDIIHENHKCAPWGPLGRISNIAADV
jgi:hypothetical protein